MNRARHALFAAFLVAAVAPAAVRADVWHRALTNGDAAHDVYEDAMRRGDDAAAMTRSQSISITEHCLTRLAGAPAFSCDKAWSGTPS